MQIADCGIRKGEKSLVFYSEIRIPCLPKRPRRQGSLASACLPQAGPFLSSLKRMGFSGG
jgi:hypothetical protein